MSFLGGAECSTAGNPLSQFQKHVQDDKTHQRDRLVNRGPNGALNGFRSTPAGPSQDDVCANIPYGRSRASMLTSVAFVHR